MESLEPKRRRRKSTVSALTASLPIYEGGEVPLFVEPVVKPTRKRKAAAADDAAPKPRRKRRAKVDVELEIVPQIEEPTPAISLTSDVPVSLDPVSDEVDVVTSTIPGLILPKVEPPKLEVVAPKREVVVEAAPDFTPPLPVAAVFAGARVSLVAISERRVTVTHADPLAPEGDLVLRIPGLFAEMSRIGARVTSSAGGTSILELTRNAKFASFAIAALQQAPPAPATPEWSAVHPGGEAGKTAGAAPPHLATIALAPTRALPATFADVRVALLEVSGPSMRIAHSKPLPLDGDHPFAIKADVADFSGSFARVVTWERLQDGRDVYVSTIEITRSAMSFTCGIDELRSAGLLREKSAIEEPVIEPEPAPIMPPPLVPIVRIRDNRLPRKHQRAQPRAVAIIAVGLFILAAIAAYVRRPDEHLRRAKAMIDAYEHGLMPSERDYSLPVYANTLQELANVRPMSMSQKEASQLAERIRKAVAQRRQSDAVKATKDE